MFRTGTNVVRYITLHVINKPISEMFQLSIPKIPVYECVRNASFLAKANADELWKSLICVSNAGKRRGRGQKADRRFKKDLNKGQKTGEGKIKMVWPGLTCPVLNANTKVKIQKLGAAEVEEKKKPIHKKPITKLHPLERGWSGRKMGGRQVPIPKSPELGSLSGFEAVVVEHKLGRIMTSDYGTTRVFRTTVVVGNRNGLIGMGKTSSKDSRGGFESATNQALKRLVHIDLEDNVSINHDFFSIFGSTRIFAFRKTEGYGLKCQRFVRLMCELLGIKNLSVNIEGPVNIKNVYRAFILGLLNQKTRQQIAKENRLYVVEKAPERYFYPKILGVPDECMPNEEFFKKPIIFKEKVMGDRTELFNRKKVPFFVKFPSYQIHLKRVLFKKNHDQVKTELRQKYGEITSHLGEVFPECRQNISQKNEPQVSQD